MSGNIRVIMASVITSFYGETYAPNVVAESLAYRLIQKLEENGYVIIEKETFSSQPRD